MSRPHPTGRRPAAFSLDDPRVAVASPDEGFERLAGEADPATLPVPLPPRPRRRFGWSGLFWSGLTGLVMLALGVTVANFVEDLFARSPWLGGIGLALALAVGLGLLALIAREIYGLARLSSIEALRERAAAVLVSDDRAAARAVVDDLLSLVRPMPQLARGRARLERHLSDIIDGRDLVGLAERELMPQLDAQARALVSAASRRVSVVTAVSPRAAIDMLFVLLNTLTLIRRLAILYGGRPGTLGVLKLLRQTVSHLAMTGGVAVTDSLIQQVVGHGVAARLSAKLGEGVLNGLLTARLGLLAIEQARPLPFAELPRPALNDIAGGLLRSGGGQGAEPGSTGPAAPGR